MFRRNIENELANWSVEYDRKPLLLRGARQVGKTTSVRNFGQTFQQYIELNLENETDRQTFSSREIDTLVQTIFLSKNKTLADKENTLLFIDEIQQVPEALNMLRYFYEKYPEIKVIAAGSLLETIFNEEKSVPVGRVDYRVMRPVSFPEFLGALGETQALEQLENTPLNDYAHNTLMRLFHTYAVIGGMPEIVNRYVRSNDFTQLSSIYERIINAYTDDVEKYGKSDSLIRVIRHCIKVGFIEAGKRITFHNFGKSDYSSREVGEALRTLEKVFLLSLIYPTTSPILPLLPDLRKSPRLQVLDTGIANYYLGIQAEILNTTDLNKIHQGAIIEHLVGQELLASKFNVLSSLNFWVREKKTSQAEIDFVYSFQSQLIPIEVKSGKEGTLKSLHLFMEECPHDFAIRFYAGPLQQTTATTGTGKIYRILNLPYYLGSQVDKYIRMYK